jgi:hypothetical protein
MNCPFCDSTRLRNSRFRFEDAAQLLILRLPVRCRHCQERSYVGIMRARQIKQESKLRHAQARLSKTPGI